MAMHSRGLVKLAEECGELVQVVSKMIAYPDLQMAILGSHPDGSNLRNRLIAEIADVRAALEFVESRLKLPQDSERVEIKITMYHQWDSEP